MDSAEVYMTLIRPSMVPVFGEAAPLEFTGQVELAGWSWTLKNDQEDTRAKEAAKAYNERSNLLSGAGSLDIRREMERINDEKRKVTARVARDKARAALRKRYEDEAGNFKEKKRGEYQNELDEIDKNYDKEEDAARKELADTLYNLGQVESKKRIKQQREELAEINALNADIKQLTKAAEEADKNKNFEFSFGKRVDIATTQMLNSMKAGDVFPTAILILHQRAAKFNHGASLVITLEKLRLLDYQLKCDVSDTMTDMREEWTAEFYSMAYVYKNRGQIKSEKGIGQMVTAAITQGTIRTFTMKNSSLPSLPI
jgi:type VI protein secretion system component Hcp